MIGLNRSIFRGMLYSYIFIFLSVLCTVGILMSYFTKSYIVQSKKQELLRQAKKVNLEFQDATEFNEGAKELLQFLDQSFDSTIWIFNDKGVILATSKLDEVYTGKWVNTSIVNKVLNGEVIVQNAKFEGLAEPAISVVVPLRKNNEIFGGIVLHAPVSDVNETVRQVREMFLWVTLFGTILIVALVSYLSWSISRPIKIIDRVASKIGMDDYSERIEIHSRNEIGELAATINNMADKLELNEKERKKQELVRKNLLENVSHELRTPLTAVQGFLEALQDDLIDEDGRHKYYKIIYNECIHMSRLVDDIMDLSRLENDEIVLSKSPVDIPGLLNKIVFKFGREAAEKGLRLDVAISGDLPRVNADPMRLEQIMNNIVKNAVKFTETGSIEINAEEDRGIVHIAVKDTGIGISPCDLELVWERFFKVDRGRLKNNKGTGVGLSIVKELIELHEGTISIESELNLGTTVHIRIPVV